MVMKDGWLRLVLKPMAEATEARELNLGVREADGEGRREDCFSVMYDGGFVIRGGCLGNFDGFCVVLDFAEGMRDHHCFDGGCWAATAEGMRCDGDNKKESTEKRRNDG